MTTTLDINEQYGAVINDLAIKKEEMLEELVKQNFKERNKIKRLKKRREEHEINCKGFIKVHSRGKVNKQYDTELLLSKAHDKLFKSNFVCPTISAKKFTFIKEMVIKRQNRPPKKQKTCLALQDNMNISFDSPTCIIRAIRSSILNNKWNHVTNLLLCLLNQKKAYAPFLMQVSKLNFAHNPADIQRKHFDEFAQMLNM